MASAPMRPIEVPPFQIQPLITGLPPSPPRIRVGDTSSPAPPPTATTHQHRSTGSASDFDSFFGQAASSSLDLFSRVTGTARAASSTTPGTTKPSSEQQQPPIPPIGQKREITSAQALNKDIFVGSSDGSLIRYSLRDDDFSNGDPYRILSEQTVPGNKSVDKIVLIPSLAKALVLSGSIIYFYTLPALDLIPQGVIAPSRGVVTFALDENALNNYRPPGSYPHGPPPVRLCIVRKRTIVVFTLRDRLQHIKDIPLPNGASRARLAGSHLFIADAVFYYTVNIDTNETFELIQWSQAELEPQYRIRPSIVVVTENEFMLVVWTGSGSLGFFFTGSGDPCRGTLEWPQHPITICVDYPYITSLLPNQTLEIHNMESLSIVAILPVPSTLQSSLLSFTPGGFLAPSIQRNLDLREVPVHLVPPTSLPTPSPPPPPPPKDEPPSGSGLTPPQTPKRPRPSLSSSSPTANLTFTRSRTLLVAPECISGLLPSTLVSQVDSLLENARVDDAIELTEQTRKKAEISGADPDQALELQLIYQKLGYKCLKATRFEDAGRLFLNGDLDPRLLIRLFPDIRGTLLTTLDEIDVFSGVVEDVNAMTSIDEIVMANLVRNYHPHIQPSIQDATPAAELRRVLTMTAKDMLKSYLKKWTSVKRQGKLPVEGGVIKKVQRVVDTVLAKLYAEDGQRTELITLIETSPDIALDELEPSLVQNNLFAILARIYEKKHDDGRLLDIWTRTVEGEYMDPALGSPLPQIVALLSECKDRVLVQRYGIWLVKRDPDAGLKLFMSKDSRKGMKMDDSLILRAIRAVDARLGEQYLEHLVLNRRNSDPLLHTQLINAYIDRINSMIKNPSTLQAWNLIINEYSARPSTSKSPLTTPSNAVPFLEYFAASDLDEEFKVLRLKVYMFLQGSIGYDLNAIRERLFQHDENNLFTFEQAVVNGKLKEHRQALNLLVLVLRDATTAESYCTLGGEVIPAKVATALGSQFGLETWGNLVVTGGVTGGPPSRNKQQNGVRGGLLERNGTPRPVVDETSRTGLIKILMQVYMDGGEQHSREAARLLNSQAINLDVMDVLSAVPSSWSLDVISSFLARSVRRTLHDQHEGLILKNLAAGQNLEISLESYDVLRQQGAVIEEAFGDDGADETPNGTFNEKQPFIDHDIQENEALSEKTSHLNDAEAGNELAPGFNPKPIPFSSINGHRGDSPVRRQGGVFPESVDSSRTIN